MSTTADIGPPYNRDEVYNNSSILVDPYKINEVYQAAFGRVRPPFPELVKDSKATGLLPFGTIGALKGAFQFKSVMNTDYTLPIKIDGWQMPQEPSIRMSGGKNVIETQLNRVDPATNKIQRKNVLEEINLNNYTISIRGVIINEDDFDAYPEEAVRRLREILEKPGSVKIENGLTALMGITKVAFTRWDLEEVNGYLGAQAFTIEGIADEDFDLEINDNPERISE